ncbi:unnamed protein product [Ectocarpus fasciculatus]
MGLTSSVERSFCGIGEAEIAPDAIHISSYPFEPSIIYPCRKIRPSDIAEIHLSTTPPTLLLAQRKELIFVSAELKNSLRSFAEAHGVTVTVRKENWELITEPYLDKSFSDDDNMRVTAALHESGVDFMETKKLRAAINAAMKSYNITSGLWDNCSLGLSDVLQAMCGELRKDDFRCFYWTAMEVELRTRTGSKRLQETE